MAPTAAPASARKSSPALKAYLVAYNAAALLGWAAVIFRLGQYFSAHGLKPEGLWDAVSTELKIVQTAAVLEVVHAALGLVRSSAVTAFIQVMSRLIVLWAITNISPPSQVSPFFTLMALAWSLVEVPRYLFYIYAELDVEPPALLTWLRYSLFMVLYPAGISGEVGCLWTALPYVLAKGVWEVKQPNPHNVAYSHYVVMWLLLALYVPGSPYMIGHMWDLRKKKLGGAKAKGE